MNRSAKHRGEQSLTHRTLLRTVEVGAYALGAASTLGGLYLMTRPAYNTDFDASLLDKYGPGAMPAAIQRSETWYMAIEGEGAALFVEGLGMCLAASEMKQQRQARREVARAMPQIYFELEFATNPDQPA